MELRRLRAAGRVDLHLVREDEDPLRALVLTRVQRPQRERSDQTVATLELRLPDRAPTLERLEELRPTPWPVAGRDQRQNRLADQLLSRPSQPETRRAITIHDSPDTVDLQDHRGREVE